VRNADGETINSLIENSIAEVKKIERENILNRVVIKLDNVDPVVEQIPENQLQI
jgi:hypothetical protein